ncbi:MAG: leucyl aminopeptidase family protein [Nitrosospira sp.]|nr:leucyl aminopeptidase family protein [Nitrosospira sp.]
MLARLIKNISFLDESTKATHILVLLPKFNKSSERLSRKPDFFGRSTLDALLKRRRMRYEEISETSVSSNLKSGALCVWAMPDSNSSTFDQQTYIRKAVQLLLREYPEEIHLVIHGDFDEKCTLVDSLIYVSWINGSILPSCKTGKENVGKKSLTKIILCGHTTIDNLVLTRAKAEGNVLARELTVLPPNKLTPILYRERIRKISEKESWKYREFNLKALRKMGAGAFVAIAQGSDPEDAAIVYLQRRVKGANKTVALVGKGICFDTGGHNLKSARYMYGMHEDMNGSAVALGILLAATRANLAVNIDCWLAISQNNISPHAYKQNDVVTALNGTTIEIIHTDAEGRMVLADTLTLAAEKRPDVVIDFATLTGSMHVALGSRHSGIFSNREELTKQALAAGKISGERVVMFPMDSDYEINLESKIADVKQCTLDGEADHILAARFLSRFVGDVPWVHMDLSASNCKEGLGAVNTDLTGFGVAWGIEMLQEILQFPRSY